MAEAKGIFAMVFVKSIHARPSSPWWAAIGAALALTALFAHPILADSVARSEVMMSLASDLGDYLIYATAAFGLFWALLHPLLAKRQISRRRWPKFSQISRELAFSLSSQVVLTAAGLYIVMETPHVMTNMMTAPSLLGWMWVIVLTFILFVAEDTAFYWTHRAIHHPLFFRHIHHVHHESHDPTPFTAFSFHPCEAVIQSINGLAVLAALALLPWHPAAIAAYGVGQIAFNIIGHLGYELYPASWNRLPLLRWKTPGLHHYLHHQMVGGNYALYFRWWDKWCGTEFADFEARYDRVFRDRSAQSHPPLHTMST